MTPEEIIERAAEVLYNHAWQAALAGCNPAHCNWSVPVEGVDEELEHARHVAQALADAGLLPTEVEQRHRCDNVTGWQADERSWLSKDCEGGHPETQHRYVTPWQEVTS